MRVNTFMPLLIAAMSGALSYEDSPDDMVCRVKLMHGKGCNEPKNGERGWSLERYVWDPETGIGRFHYVRGEDGGAEEQTTVARSQRKWMVR